MSRKIKTTNIRLGIIQIWNFRNQNFGNIFKIYKKNLIYKNQLLILFIQIYKKSKQILSKVEIFWKHNIIYCNIYIHKLDKLLCYPKILPKNFQTNNLYNYKINIRYFIKNKSLFTAFYLSNYFEYLFLKEQSIKKSITSILHLLNKLDQNPKIFNSQKGPIKLLNIGYKIKISGRFDNTKTQMAKSLIFQNGKISSVSLNNFIDFYNRDIFTKFGSFSFSLWLFYKKIYKCD